MVAEYLRFRGFAVRQAASGSAALKIARHQLPKVILMDLSMPEVDGWEATRQLKADPKTREAIVIAVTAHALSPDEQKARDAGCDGFIAKPFDLSVLADGLERVMVLGRQGLAFLSKISHAAPKRRKDAGT
jgi:two-component system cell cycle response regulator DivK